MREEVLDEWGRLTAVEAGGTLDLGIVGVWLGDDADPDGAPSLRLPATDARKMAAALLRAADEAEGVTFLQAAIDGSHDYDRAEYAEDACQAAGPVVDFVQMLEGEK